MLIADKYQTIILAVKKINFAVGIVAVFVVSAFVAQFSNPFISVFVASFCRVVLASMIFMFAVSFVRSATLPFSQTLRSASAVFLSCTYVFYFGFCIFHLRWQRRESAKQSV